MSTFGHTVSNLQGQACVTQGPPDPPRALGPGSSHSSIWLGPKNIVFVVHFEFFEIIKKFGRFQIKIWHRAPLKTLGGLAYGPGHPSADLRDAHPGVGGLSAYPIPPGLPPASTAPAGSCRGVRDQGRQLRGDGSPGSQHTPPPGKVRLTPALECP